jgi:hypothetical protein
MENEELDLDNLTKEDFVEMAKYCHHLENENRHLVEELKNLKAHAFAIVQQRNSFYKKLEELKVQSVGNTIIEAVVLDSSLDLINPEQHRVKQNGQFLNIENLL